jgi:hypothetical protein
VIQRLTNDGRALPVDWRRGTHPFAEASQTSVAWLTFFTVWTKLKLGVRAPLQLYNEFVIFWGG